jgi:hypothetical protein
MSSQAEIPESQSGVATDDLCKLGQALYFYAYEQARKEGFEPSKEEPLEVSVQLQFKRRHPPCEVPLCIRLGDYSLGCGS